ncbi:unnamed protein product, partial [Rotaria sp. Silwood2]
MSTFVLLDSTPLAELCRGLLQICQEPSQDTSDSFHLPKHKLDYFQERTLVSLVQQRYNELKKFNPCYKTNILLIKTNDKDVDTCKLIHLYPLLVQLNKRHETLTQILHDQMSYNQQDGIQLSYLRVSDCIAL